MKTVYSVLCWIFGLIFLAGGLAIAIHFNALQGLSLIVIGLLLLPITRKVAYLVTKKSLGVKPRFFSILIMLIAFIVISVLEDKRVMTSRNELAEKSANKKNQLLQEKIALDKEIEQQYRQAQVLQKEEERLMKQRKRLLIDKKALNKESSNAKAESELLKKEHQILLYMGTGISRSEATEIVNMEILKKQLEDDKARLAQIRKKMISVFMEAGYSRDEAISLTDKELN